MNSEKSAAKTAAQIRELEDGFCNPRKLKEAQELRDDLSDRGYTKAEIAEMVGDNS